LNAGWKPGLPGGKPPRKTQTYNPSATFLSTRLRGWLWLWLWLDLSLKLISSHLSKLSKKPIVVETNALQCAQHSHLCVFFYQSSRWSFW